LNNCDLAVTNDTLRSAPACTTTIKLPRAWHTADLRASYVQPETQQSTPLKADEFVFDRQTGTALLKTPPFPTYLIVYVQALELKLDAD
jgi:hypothetical protein